MNWPVREEVLLSDDDRLQVEAFKEFLNSGRWTYYKSVRIFATDSLSHDFATGKITAKEYLSTKRRKVGSLF